MPSAMKISPQLRKQVTKAVRTSMRIEGYVATRSEDVKVKARALMEQRRAQVSLSAK